MQKKIVMLLYWKQSQICSFLYMCLCVPECVHFYGQLPNAPFSCRITRPRRAGMASRHLAITRLGRRAGTTTTPPFPQCRLPKNGPQQSASWPHLQQCPKDGPDTERERERELKRAHGLMVHRSPFSSGRKPSTQTHRRHTAQQTTKKEDTRGTPPPTLRTMMMMKIIMMRITDGQIKLSQSSTPR